MLIYIILNVYFQYLKCLLTLFLKLIYNILKNIQWAGPIGFGLSKRASLTRICEWLIV